MGNVFLHGKSGGGGGSGGSELTIVGGTTRPAKATQNTIWVNTDVEITGFQLCQDIPRYELDSAIYGITSEANITLYTIDGRNHIKVNGGEAIYTLAKSANGYWALMLVSPDADAVTTKNSYKSSETRPYQGTVAYEGVTYYWGRADYGSSGTFNVTPKYSDTITSEELALLMAKEYHTLKESSAVSEQSSEGTVRITIGNVSNTKLYAPVGDDWIAVYVISAKQYIGGEWVTKSAMSYQNGEWVTWIPYGALCWYGDECYDFTGGWGTLAWKVVSDATVNTQTFQITKGTDYLLFEKTGDYGAVMHTINAIDLTNVKAIHFKGEMSPASRDYWVAFHVWTKLGGTSSWATNSAATVKTNSTSGTRAFTLDVSALTGSYYLGFGIYSASHSVKIEELYLEVA